MEGGDMAKRLLMQNLSRLVDVSHIGDFLFDEALQYDQLEFVAVGTHTCYIIHYDPEGKKRPWVSFHYRRNLKQLSDIVGSDVKDYRRKIREISRTFLTTLEVDLHLFAVEMIENPLLKDVRILVGLSGLSAPWGRHHGFTTALYADDEETIRRHNDSIADYPSRDKEVLTPLNLFFITPRRFIKEFHKGELSCT